MENCIKIQKGFIKKIPVLFCALDTENEKKPIILLHKLLKDKESELEVAVRLAENNYLVIIPDLLFHGEYKNSFRYTNKLDFNKLFTELDTSMKNIEDIVNYIKQGNIKNVSYDDMCVMGTSYGGMLSLTAGYYIDDIKAVVAINSSARWLEFIESGSFETFRFFSCRRPVIKLDEVDEYIKKYDPYFNVEKYNNKPILLMNGALDTTFTYRLIRPFYEKILRGYEENKATDNILWKRYEKVGHQVNYPMISDCLGWLDIFYKRR